MNKTVVVKLAPASVMRESAFLETSELTKLTLAELHSYTDVCNRDCEDFSSDDELCEKLFVISNAPYIDPMVRADYFGKSRSLSVGDVISIDGRCYVCAPFGWELVK